MGLNLGVHRNLAEGVKIETLGSAPEASDSVGLGWNLRIFISN